MSARTCFLVLFVLSVAKWLLSMATLTDIRVGFLLETGGAEIFDRVRIQPAVDIALETVRRRVSDGTYRNFSISYLFQSTGPRCSPSSMSAPGVASRLFHQEGVRALLGPACSFQCKAVADLAAYWNIPVLSGASTSGDLVDKEQYKTLTRTAFRLGVMGQFSVALFREWSWTRCSIIWTDASIWRLITRSIRSRLEAAHIYVNPVVLAVHESNEQALEAAVRWGRIIFIIAPVGVVRDIMVKAYRSDYINGEYVFFSVHLFNNRWRFGDASWKQGDEFDAEAKVAFQALMTFRLLEPSSDEFEEFTSDLHHRRTRDFNWTNPPGDDFNFFTSAFHDVMILFSLAVNETLSENGDLSDGYTLTRKMWNRTFEGISGLVTVNSNGDRDADYSLWDMTDTNNGISTVVYNFYGATGKLEFVGDISWAAGAVNAPPDTPFCGFDNENPACQHQDSTVITTIIIASCLVGFGGVIILVIYRKLKLSAEIQSRAWQIKWEDLQTQCDDVRRTSSHFSLTSISLKTTERNQIFTQTALYQARTVAVKRLTKQRVDLNRAILIELKNMRDLEHPNLVRFIGVCLDVNHVAIVNEYCPKGSLLDILHNDSIKLDWLFKYSLISDVIKGVQYLHRSALLVHGRVNSSNCLVDSRFVLKLADFGLHAFRDEGALTQDNHAVLRKSLWVAPELLREPKRVPTREGDIYSVGIIMREVATREEPYEAESKEMELSEILEKIQSSSRSDGQPFRPRETNEFIDPELSELMKACWVEEAGGRPTASSLDASMTKINRAKNTGTSILDNLLNRMEQYASNLEELVQERTAAFLEEKQRAETLLYELLPRVVADRLKEGKAVNPESYDNVTIFFSDIKGFTELSAQSTPMQVVMLLNDLYTCFDGIIGNFDVYKVETIGDAYMVVSGAPVRNGNAHVPEIANMALALLQAVDSFTIRHKKDRKLHLRVGIHTGPCVAGVVGLKMPRYCLFGDTVNTASRMESNGEAMKIHISSDTKAVLENFDGFRIELRGRMDMKGKGSQTTYWLLGCDAIKTEDDCIK